MSTRSGESSTFISQNRVEISSKSPKFRQHFSSLEKQLSLFSEDTRNSVNGKIENRTGYFNYVDFNQRKTISSRDNSLLESKNGLNTTNSLLNSMSKSSTQSYKSSNYGSHCNNKVKSISNFNKSNLFNSSGHSNSNKNSFYNFNNNSKYSKFHTKKKELEDILNSYGGNREVFNIKNRVELDVKLDLFHENKRKSQNKIEMDFKNGNSNLILLNGDGQEKVSSSKKEKNYLIIFYYFFFI